MNLHCYPVQRVKKLLSSNIETSEQEYCIHIRM